MTDAVHKLGLEDMAGRTRGAKVEDENIMVIFEEKKSDYQQISRVNVKVIDKIGNVQKPFGDRSPA
jgi:hypothetical protein